MTPTPLAGNSVITSDWLKTYDKDNSTWNNKFIKNVLEAQVLAIDKWNTDSVEEFLKTHLVSDSEDNSDFLKTNMV